MAGGAREFDLRPVTAADRPFLLEVYRSTRQPELDTIVDWTGGQKDAFVRQQFEAQDAWYRQNYSRCAFSVVAVGGALAGRLYVDRRSDEIRIVEIALLPEYRGRGLGTRLIGALLEEGRAAGLPVTIHVEIFNPALRLYERLGFRAVEDHGVHRFLRWQPALTTNAESILQP